MTRCTYDSSTIKVLEGLDPVRKMPPIKEWTDDDWLRAVYLADEDVIFRAEFAEAIHGKA